MAIKALRQIKMFPTGVRAKMTWAFVLMSCIPLGILVLVAGWFVFPYTRQLFPALARYIIDPVSDPAGATWWIWAVVALTVLISLLGSIYLGVKIIEPILHVSQQAKRLADDPGCDDVLSEQEDELGDLTGALNKLTGRIREHMTELKQFGERTSQINIEIHKRMVMLSGLLQISELIGKEPDLDTVLDLVVERLASVEDRSFSFLCLQPVESLNVAARHGHQIDMKRLAHLVFESSSVLIDATHPPTSVSQALWEELGRPNLILQTLFLRTRSIGVLAFGNHEPQYSFHPEVIDLVTVFAKQSSLALENELLLKRNKALAVKDELTGLYNETYIRQRLEEEIKRAIAYQRPCALITFTIDRLEDIRRRKGPPEAERVVKKVARIIQESVTENDRVGRFNGEAFVVVLPERNKRQAIEIAEEIRRRVEFAFGSSSDPDGRMTVSGGVAENPIDGVTAEDLLSKSSAAANGTAHRGANAVVA